MHDDDCDAPPAKKRLAVATPSKGGDRYIPRREDWSTRYASISSPLKPPAPPSCHGTTLFNYGSPQKLGLPSSSNFYLNYKNCPLTEESRNLLTSPRKMPRKISKTPFKVLDAPELQSDFYLNLIDWSAENVLAVGLSSAVYLWNATTSQVTKLCDLTEQSDTVTSVQWNDDGDALAVGTNTGVVHLWDVNAKNKVVDIHGHANRVACMTWGAKTLCSGSRDRKIFERDLRDPATIVRSMDDHKAEVCGLKWSCDKTHLASGGNDNCLYVWDTRTDRPLQKNEHNAAIKALAWSPHNRGLLISGGGTQDRCLRFWNVLNGQLLSCADTGSQVCNVAWSKITPSEFVTTHGYSSNQVVVWKYPTLEPIAKLGCDTQRVLYMAMSPDGESVVTGTGGEAGTLRFWRLFWKLEEKRNTNSKLNLFNKLR
uniref:WD_REPEATS_REGION domain-containing protein n=1 Tax=Steinernema glaseri TaxID=37863 RepID=A0A1I7ZQL8_9BILA